MTPARLQPGPQIPRIITRPDGTRYVALPKAAPPENRADPNSSRGAPPHKPPVKRGFRLHPSLRRGQRTVRKDANPHYPITTKPSARASRRSVVRNNPTLARPRLTPYQKDLQRKANAVMSTPQTPPTNEPTQQTDLPPAQPNERPSSGSEPDPTPPFTEGVPNPPTGPEAAERIADNIEAAEQRGDEAAAEGYEEKARENLAASDANDEAKKAASE